MPDAKSSFLSPPEHDTPEPELSADQRAIAEECDALKAMLLEKNRAYGSSAFDPVRIFSRSDALEQINVRIDDKLSRIARADPNALGEDAEADLLGYLVLRRIQRRRMRSGKTLESLADRVANIINRDIGAPR